MTAPMKKWPVQDAKARFSEMLDDCIAKGPQMVTRRGEEAAVLVTMEEWKRMSASAKPSLHDLLLGDGPRFELELPKRGRARRRQPPEF
jgi:antitoxin Phd